MPERGSGYYWAETINDDGALIVLIVIDKTGSAKGYVPGREDAIDLSEIVITGPVKWSPQVTIASRVFEPPKCGARAADAAHECRILPFVANA